MKQRKPLKEEKLHLERSGRKENVTQEE